MADCLLQYPGPATVQKSETELAEIVLNTLLPRGPGLSGLGGQTVRKYGHRTTANTQKQARLPDCLMVTSRLSTNRESARTKHLKNRLQPIATKF
jgi:hypothetical protein